MSTIVVKGNLENPENYSNTEGLMKKYGVKRGTLVSLEKSGWLIPYICTNSIMYRTQDIEILIELGLIKHRGKVIDTS